MFVLTSLMRWAIPTVLLAIIAACWAWHLSEVRAARSEVLAEWAADTAIRSRIAKTAQERLESREATHAQEIADLRAHTAKWAAAAASANAGASSARERLRVAISARRATGSCEVPGPGPTGPVDDGGPASSWDILEECSGHLVRVAAEAESAANQTRALQDYVRSVIRLDAP